MTSAQDEKLDRLLDSWRFWSRILIPALVIISIVGVGYAINKATTDQKQTSDLVRIKEVNDLRMTHIEKSFEDVDKELGEIKTILLNMFEVDKD